MRGIPTKKWNKSGVALAIILFWLAASGVVGIGLAGTLGVVYDISDATEAALRDSSFTPLSEPGADYVRLSYISGIHQTANENNTAYESRGLYPLEDENTDLDYGLLFIHWDRLRNAIGFKNFTSLSTESVIQRSFFVNINGNSTAVDPLNNTNCITVNNDEGYMCVFEFRVDNDLAPGGVFYEVNIVSSSTSHDRLFDTVYLTPIGESKTTSDSIITYYFDQSKIVSGLAMDILVGVYYFVIIGLALGGVLLIFVSLKQIYIWISTGGKEAND